MSNDARPFAGTFFDKLRVRLKRDGLPEAYQRVFSEKNPHTEIVLNDLVKRCGLMMGHEGWPNEQLQYNAGAQDIVKYILGQLRMQPQDLQRLAEREVIP